MYELDFDLEVELKARNARPFRPLSRTYHVSGVVTYCIKEGEPADEYSPGYRDEAESIDATVKKADCLCGCESPLGQREKYSSAYAELEEAVCSHFENNDEVLVKHAEACERNY